MGRDGVSKHRHVKSQTGQFRTARPGWKAYHRSITIHFQLFEKFPKIPARSYSHIHELLDAWSLVVNFIVPVPRSKMVLYHESITLSVKLGSGAFGEVFKAKILPPEGTEQVECAVKRAIGDAKRATIQEFCHEARIMGVLRHPNVVGFYGIASLSQPLMLVMELVSGGDLKKYVKTTANLSHRQIVTFALDIARGMKHLSSKKVIHRDLAARNCLITKALQVKISDFGLSVQGNEIIVKNLKKAPIRWLSPETLSKGMFNERTDVWSYGVLLTELLTKCANDPLYPRDLKDAQAWIKESEHPHHVEAEPKELAELVDACCQKLPANRINFNTIKRRLGDIIKNYPPTEKESKNEKLRTPTTPEDKKRGTLEIGEERKSGSTEALQQKGSTAALTRKKSKTVKEKAKKKSGTKRDTTVSPTTKEKASKRRTDLKGKLPPGMT
uniref:Protein kinase domain-containing protein n=1 Tax=Caenorhabditis japonica TaxID=281687 RepID=A0A8R1E4E9_CAEJA